jgi:hypothetical protein
MKIQECFELIVAGAPLLLVSCAAPADSAAFNTPAMDEVSVDFGIQLEVPTYRASGFIYGLSEDGAQPDRELQKGIKVRFFRAGGAQLGCPGGGFVNGQYAQRWTSVKGYYARARAIGAKFILLTHDLWGADAVCTVPRWPGDGGDWTEFTRFMAQVIDDAKTNGMTGPDVQWDIWNEPDLLTPVQFWGRDQAQYLEMWKHSYRQIRAAIPDAVIVGPSTAGQPSPGWSWFAEYLDFVKANDVVPDYVSWHQLIPGSDPQTSKDNLDEMLTMRGISVHGYQVNEYGSNPSEQQAGPSAWYLGRLERAGIDGLRANWGMGGGLYEGMGDLVTGSGLPMASWWSYKRYAEMSGKLVPLSAGTKIDGVASIDPQATKSSILLGSRQGVVGRVRVTLQNIPAYLLNKNQVQVVVERIPEGIEYLSKPIIVTDQKITVTQESLDLMVNWISAADAYAIAISPG